MGQESKSCGNRNIALFIALAAMFVSGSILGHRQIISPDLGFHLSSAKWILENGRIPSKDIFTYTVTENTYIDLQWTYQLVVYGLLKMFGAGGISALTTLLTLIFSATLLWRVKLRNGNVTPAALIMLLLFFLGNLWEVRPHLFSWIYGSLIFLVLEQNDRGKKKWLPFLPVLMLLWVNAHSLYVLGLIGIAAYVFADVLKNSFKHGKPYFDKPLILWSAAALAACLINPYNIGGLKFPVSQFFLIQGGAGYKSTVSGTAEFLSPFRFAEFVRDGRLVIFQPRLWWQLTGLAAIAGMVAGYKKMKLPEWILFAGFLFIFNQASKNFGYFLMATFPAIVTGLDVFLLRIRNLLLRKKNTTNKETANRFGFGYAAVTVVCVLLIAAAGSNRLYDLGWQQAATGTGFNKEALPVGACKFITDNNISGRIINCWDDGGYIGFVTGQKVFINSEGNTIGLKFYDEYVKIRGPEGFAAGLKKYKPEVAVVRFRVTPFWLYYLYNAAKDWRMVYADNFTAVFLHESVSPQIGQIPPAQPVIDYLEYDLEQIRTVVQEVVRHKHPDFIKRLNGSRAYPLDNMQRSSFYLHTNQVDACIGTSVEGLSLAGFIVPDLMLNLGHALNAKKQYALADICYDAFLSTDGNPILAEEISMERRRRR